MIRRCAIATALALAAWPAQAQAPDAPRAAHSTAARASWRDGLRLNLALEGAPDVDFGDADVSWVRTNGRIALQGPVSERWGLGVSLSGEMLVSEVDDAATFLAPAADGDGPLRDLFESTLSAGMRRRIGERFAIGADGYVTAKLEPGAELGNSLKGGGVFSLLYRRSDTLSVAVGAKLGSRLDREGPFAWPTLRVEWHITPRLELDINNATVRLGYAVWDGLELLGFASYRSDRYRMERRELGPLAADAGTIGVRSATLGAGVRWNLSEHVRLLGTVGLSVWQRLLVNDGDDARVASRESEGAAAVLALRLQTRF